MNRFLHLMADTLADIPELMPWDVDEQLRKNPKALILDVREPREFEAMHISGSMNVPRGVLESACEWDYDETEPELVRARDREIYVVCRSGHRSLLAAHSLRMLGFKKVISMKTGLRGWKDYELPLVDKNGKDVDLDYADEFFTTKLRKGQMRPANWVD